MHWIRNHSKFISSLLLLIFVESFIIPISVKALTSGPTSPEMQSFEPISTSQMVDKFTGDFKYNIPLMQVGEYPINVAYNSGIKMDQEASWVGLGWNINPGVINRSMRGLPDDFKGDKVKKQRNIADNKTIGANIGVGNPEIYGSAIGFKEGNLGLYHNSYKGWGFDIAASATASISGLAGGHLGGGLNLNVSSRKGIGLSPNLTFSGIAGKYGNLSLGASYNSKAGLMDLSFGTSIGLLNPTAPITFGQPSFTPTSEFPWESENYNFRGTVGPDISGLHFNLFMNGYYSKQGFAKNTDILDGYGYLYSHEGHKNPKALLDFNRHKAGAAGAKIPNLPVTNLTYDVYTVVGQGLSGTYRPFRNDIGMVFDKQISSTSKSGSFGLEPGVGLLFRAGVDIKTINSNTSKGGKWISNNYSAPLLAFKNQVDKKRIMPFYFGNAGEKTAIDEDFYTRIKKDDAVRVEIDLFDGNLSAWDFYFNYSQSKPDPIPGNNSRKEKAHVNQAMDVLMAKYATEAALEEKINAVFKDSSYNSDGNLPLKVSIPRINTLAKEHHISQIKVIKRNGKQYIYGIPAYNTYQKEVSFNVDGNNAICDKGLVEYNPTDASLSNNKGVNNLYSSTEIPPYAYSYLLTAVLSPEYVDVSDNGISEDDLGSYTKFNYSRPVKDYQWRAPFEENKANLNEGRKAISEDNKGNYLYGKKELWYLHSIESKTHIAEFSTSKRHDAYEVAWEHGGIGNDPMYKLDKISLYSKPDRKKNGDNAVPIKEVHFKYNYHLCQELPNNDGLGTDNEGGKLTLEKLYFTYGNSQKGELHPYKFYYGYNPDYNMKAKDRWGFFKPNNMSNCNFGGADMALSNSDFPFVEQKDENLTHKWQSAWNLNQIELPSGGVIEVKYESDDYGYVQNRRAMQMFKVLGWDHNLSGYPNLTNQLYKDKYNIADYLFVELEKGVNNLEELKRRYFGGKEMLDNFYYKAYVHLKDGKHDFVDGYTKVINYGLIGPENDVAWIRIERDDVEHRSFQTHPISKKAWSLLRTDLRTVLKGTGQYSKFGIGTFARGLVQIAREVGKIFKGYEGLCFSKNYAKNVVNDKTWVRLFNPDFQKLGGGSRVKKLTISDKWGDMVGDQDRNFKYGKEFDYTIIQDEERISSGVASYEPVYGKQENPFVQPVITTLPGNPLSPSEKHYKEKPYTESLFPGASVGYSMVTERSLQHDGVERTATGKTIHEFFTAKDYPTISKTTGKVPEQTPNQRVLDGLKKMFGFTIVKKYGTSQGYVVELNDMHGKPKAVSVYKELNNRVEKNKVTLIKENSNRQPVSIKRFYYYDEQHYPSENQKGYVATPFKKLVNKVNVLNDKGQLEQARMGMDFEMVHDTRRERSYTNRFGGSFNVEITLLGGFIPFILPIPCPQFPASDDLRVYKSIATTKVIKRYGIQEKVEVWNKSSRIDQKNLAYDKKTGQVLLTSTQNEFEDRIYNFSYPAYWKYKGMGHAFQNLGLEFKNIVFKNGKIDQGLVNPEDYFITGDKLLINNGEDALKYLWVYKSNGEMKFLDKEGKYIAYYSADHVKIIESGYSNRMNESMGNVTTMENPVVTGAFKAEENVIEATAKTFNQKWQGFPEYTKGHYPSPHKQEWMYHLEDLFSKLAQNDELVFEKNEVAVNLSDQPYRENYIYLRDSVLDDQGNCAGGGEDEECYFSDCKPENVCRNKNKECLQDFFDALSSLSAPPYYINYSLSSTILNDYLNCSPCEQGINEFSLGNPFYYHYKVKTNEQCELFVEIYEGSYSEPISTHFICNGSTGSFIESSSSQTPFSGECRDSLIKNFYKNVKAHIDTTPGDTLEIPADYKDPHFGLVNPEEVFACNLEDLGKFKIFGLDENDSLKLTLDEGASGCNIKVCVERNFRESDYHYEINSATETTNTFSDSLTFLIGNYCCGSWVLKTFNGTNIFWSNIEDFKNLKPHFNLCNDVGFYVDAIMQDERTVPLQGTAPMNCSANGIPYCKIDNNLGINPFLNGIFGNWHEEKTFKYVTDRLLTDNNNSTNLKMAGQYEEFQPFWYYNNNKWKNNEELLSWVLTNEVTIYGPNGNELENQDALGRYSSALFGYDHQKPVSVAVNAKYDEIAFDGFESYSYENGNCCYIHTNWNTINKISDLNRNKENAHTGLYSLKLDPGASFLLHHTFNEEACEYFISSAEQYNTSQDDLINRLSIEPNVKCLLQGWVKQVKPVSEISTDTSTPEINLIGINYRENYNDVDSTIITLKPSGPVIDGWQRISGSFMFQEEPAVIKLFLVSGDTETYFDDIRFQPFNAQMRSFVYNPIKLRLMAELDENNFATFYEYDLEGNLQRIKKETVRGVKTIKESRSSKTKVKY